MATNPYESTGDHVPPARTSGMAIASFVCGLFSFVTCLFAGIPAVILGIVSLGQINRSGGALKGSGLATAGIVTGAIGSMLSVVAMLIALLLPAIQAAREAARSNASTNNLKQIGLALHNYHDMYGSFPPQATLDANGQPLLSWRVLILPFLEQQPLYAQFKLDEPWDSPHNRPLMDLMPNVYESPSSAEQGATTTFYQMPIGPGTVFSDPTKKITRRDITAGLSNVIFVVEANADRAVNWTEPADLGIGPASPIQGSVGRLRSGGIFLALFGDGSVRRVDPTSEPVEQMLARGPEDQGNLADPLVPE